MAGSSAPLMASHHHPERERMVGGLASAAFAAALSPAAPVPAGQEIGFRRIGAFAFRGWTSQAATSRCPQCSRDDCCFLVRRTILIALKGLFGCCRSALLACEPPSLHDHRQLESSNRNSRRSTAKHIRMGGTCLRISNPLAICDQLRPLCGRSNKVFLRG